MTSTTSPPPTPQESTTTHRSVDIIEKTQVILGNRIVEVSLIECDVNQYGYRNQRVYARFIDNSKEVHTKQNHSPSKVRKQLQDQGNKSTGQR